MEPSNKVTSIILTSVVLSALVVGGSVYAYQKSVQNKQSQELQSQIDSLTQQVQTTKVSSSTPAPSAATSPTPTSQVSDTAAYSNSKYNFSFSYPKSWNIKEGAYKGANLIVSLNEKQPVDGTDKPADLTVYVMEYVKPLDSPNMFTSLEDWLKDPANKDYKNVKAVNIGGRSGFSADAGNNKFGGGVYYFVPQKDKSIIDIYCFNIL